MAKFTVSAAEQGTRLDLYLTLKFPQYSRSAVRKLLDTGKVRRNSEIEFRPNYRVVADEQFELEGVAELERQALRPYEIDLEVVYQDEDLLVVNKPSGLKVHPTHHNERETLINALYFMLEQQGKLGVYGVNLINRIDKETSGLVLAALSPKGAWHYAKLFAESKVNKVYLAVVYGNWFNKHGDVKVKQSSFLRYNQQLRMQEIDRDQLRGEYAESDFQFIDFNSEHNLSLVRAQPLTGRTHQLRVQLAHMGFPIVGDTKYTGMQYSRLMLHALRVQLEQPNGEKLKIEASVPEDFTALFNETTL